MIRTLLIDDEQPARERLKRLLSRHPDVQVIGEAGDGRQALQKIHEQGPDLIFLDIEMPLHSGIEVASRMRPPRPRVIFCTAFDNYALQAFEHNALDYLLKPVTEQRLALSLQRIREAQRQFADGLEIEEAGRTQRRLFPRFESLCTLACHGSCTPARGVGGDYYDFVPLGEGQVGVAVGDVSGKGVYAGLLMAGLQGRVQSHAAQFQDDLKGLFGELNRQLWRSTEDNRYATLFYGCYDDQRQRLRYVNAGHPAPLLFRAGRPEKLESAGLPLGLFPDAEYTDRECLLDCGDRVILCSDGVLEAENPEGTAFGYGGLVNAVEPNLQRSPERLHDAIIQQLEAFRQGREPQDDLTLVVLEVRPRVEASHTGRE